MVDSPFSGKKNPWACHLVNSHNFGKKTSLVCRLGDSHSSEKKIPDYDIWCGFSLFWKEDPFSVLSGGLPLVWKEDSLSVPSGGFSLLESRFLTMSSGEISFGRTFKFTDLKCTFSQ
ncbi:hypothetical protein CDAR_208611 [Caerostris darwini]|uniref:Uncharacterized protein n=1 Tax=Caerostris darwini TaxID=1538125 RepID=A0AAV4VQU6_9ARAC|nr:hypothetical protein CDAR_208611 [Caerostris darwini]